MNIWMMLIIEIVIAALAIFGWQYCHHDRYRNARNRLQHVVAEALRDTNQDAFLFVVRRNAESIEVQLDANTEALRQFESFLSERLSLGRDQVKLMVVPLKKEDISHLGSKIVVWGKVGGDVYVARGHV